MQHYGFVCLNSLPQGEAFFDTYFFDVILPPWAIWFFFREKSNPCLLPALTPTPRGIYIDRCIKISKVLGDRSGYEIGIVGAC